MARDWRPFRLGEALNYHLKPQPIAITDCVLAPENFHARFSALERRYHFRILSRRAPAVHQAGLVWQIKHGLDVEAMQAAADLLVGKHDFTTFRSTVCQAESPVKTLDRLQVSQVETMAGTEYHFDVRARSFLHNQVRSFVGSLERVGAGSWSVADMGTALAAKDRAACGPVCPPQGLYLAHVSYPVDPFAKA
jgi:tRNA pseudouridine38-40 synthase